MKPKLIAQITLFLGLTCLQSRADLYYSQPFTLTQPFGASPFRVQNAFLHTEPFGSPVRYWRPAQPNVWGEVVYRFDVGFPIAQATMFMTATAYTLGSAFNIDANAQVYVDVSPNDVDYTNYLGSYPGHVVGTGPLDISQVVDGSEFVFVRARLFMTTDYGSYSAAQFLRGDPGATFFVSATGIPDRSSTATVVVAAFLALLLFRRTRLVYLTSAEQVARANAR